MVLSASHFKDVTNGYEKRTDGLWTHTGKFVVRQGPVDLPSGSIGTSELAADAVHGVLAELVFLGNGVGVAASGTWQVVPQFTTPSVACSGASVACEYGITFSNTVAGQGHYIGVGTDGVAAIHYGYYVIPASQPTSHTSVHRFLPSPGNHTFGVFILTGGGQWSVWGGGYSYIRLWEVRA